MNVRLSGWRRGAVGPGGGGQGQQYDSSFKRMAGCYAEGRVTCWEATGPG